MALSDDLKKAIRDSDMSLSAIARESGVARTTLRRFLAGAEDGDVGLENVGDKLAKFFGLKLVHDGRTPAPEPPPLPLSVQIRKLLAKNPNGLTLEQIKKRFPGRNISGGSVAGRMLGAMKQRGLVRKSKRSGIIKLGRKPGPSARILVS